MPTETNNQNKKIKKRFSERGSVFFYILLGVALFAALAYTTTRSSRNTTSNILTKRQAEIAASEIIDYSQKVARVVDQIRLNGVSETDINFASKVFSRHQATLTEWQPNPNCADVSCAVFATYGGPLSETTFEKYASTLELPYASSHPKAGHPSFSRVSVIGAGSQSEDLILYIIKIKDSVCDAINTALNLPDIDTTTEEVWNSFGVPGQTNSIGYWDLQNTQSSEPLFDEATAFQGKQEGCYSQDGYRNTYFKILLER